MNETCGPEGIVPNYIVYGVTLMLAEAPSGPPAQETRMDMMETAKRERSFIATGTRMKRVSGSAPRHQPFLHSLKDALCRFRRIILKGTQ